MEDQNKTRKQLIGEIQDLRREFTEIKQLLPLRQEMSSETTGEGVRLDALLLDSLPHPAMLIGKERVVLAANRIAREIGARPEGFCWRDFGQSQFIPDEHKEYINEHAGTIPPGGTRCIHCLSDVALAEKKSKCAPQINAFGRVWEAWWVPLDSETYLHYAIDITDRKRAEDELQRYRESLEMLVEERTAELRKANDQLRAQMVERELVEKALRESESRFRALFDQTFQFTALVKPDGELLGLNRTGLQVGGYEQTEVAGRPFWDAPWWDGLEETRIRLQSDFRRAAGGELVHYEIDVFTVAKDLIVIDFSLKPLLDEDGRIDLLIAEGRDITAIKQTERKLRESEEKYRTIFDYSPLGVLHLDVDGTITACNKQVVEILGSTTEKLIGFKTMESLRDPEMRGAISASLSGKLGQYEGTYRSVTGAGTIPLKAHYNPITSVDGEILGAIGIIEDISEARLAEEAMRQKNALMETVLSNIHIQVAYLDSDFNFVQVNEAFARSAGHSRELFTGKNHFQLYPNEENRAIFDEVVRSGEPHFAFEKPFEYSLLPERGVTYGDWSLQPIIDAGGKVSALILSLIDRTDRVRAKKELEFERKRLFALLSELPAFIFLLSRDRRVVYANSRFKERFTEPEGKHCYELFHGRKEPCDNCRTLQLFETGAQVSWEWTNPHGVTYQIYDYPFMDLDGSSSVLEMAIDITDRKRAEEALKESEERLRFLSSKLLTVQEDERARLAKHIHDSVGQTLAAIKFGLETVQRALETEIGSAAQQSLDALVPVVQDAIIDVRELYMDLRPTILDDFGILAAIDWLCRKMKEKNPNIHVEKEIEIQEVEVPRILKTVIFRIVQDALDNIVKHSKAEFVALSARKMDRAIELSIEDSGIGFDPHFVFSRDHVPRGLGLVSMKERVELSGGTLSIFTAKGEGTQIEISLPIGLHYSRHEINTRPPADIE